MNFSYVLKLLRLSSISSFHNLSKNLRKFASIVIDENDLTEKFVRGAGPGGQSVNKSKNCVQLVHIPTGTTVHCQEQRDLTTNRKIARRLLQQKLEFQLNGEDSKMGRRISRLKRRKYNSARRSREKYSDADKINSDSIDEEEVEEEEDDESLLPSYPKPDDNSKSIM
eukprot:gene2152-4190_t